MRPGVLSTSTVCPFSQNPFLVSIIIKFVYLLVLVDDLTASLVIHSLLQTQNNSSSLENLVSQTVTE